MNNIKIKLEKMILFDKLNVSNIYQFVIEEFVLYFYHTKVTYLIPIPFPDLLD